MSHDKDFIKTNLISAISILLGSIVIIITNIGNINFSFYQALSFSVQLGFSSEMITFAYIVTHEDILKKINKNLIARFTTTSIIYFIFSYMYFFNENRLSNNNNNNNIYIDTILNFFTSFWRIIGYYINICILSFSFFYAFIIISLMLYRYIIKHYNI